MPKVWPAPSCCESLWNDSSKPFQISHLPGCKKKEQSLCLYLRSNWRRVFFWWVWSTSSWSGMWDLLGRRKSGQQLWSRALHHIRKNKPADIKTADWNLVKGERSDKAFHSEAEVYFFFFFSLRGWRKMSYVKAVVVEFDHRWIDKKFRVSLVESCSRWSD